MISRVSSVVYLFFVYGYCFSSTKNLSFLLIKGAPIIPKIRIVNLEYEIDCLVKEIIDLVSSIKSYSALSFTF